MISTFLLLELPMTVLTSMHAVEVALGMQQDESPLLSPTQKFRFNQVAEFCQSMHGTSTLRAAF